MSIASGISQDAVSDAKPVDLESIARRIVALADVSVQEHLAALARSQADALIELVQQSGQQVPEVFHPQNRLWCDGGN